MKASNCALRFTGFRCVRSGPLTRARWAAQSPSPPIPGELLTIPGIRRTPRAHSWPCRRIVGV